MANLPVKSATTSSIAMINAIRAENSQLYQERIPKATKDNLSDVWNALDKYESHKNDFIKTLVTRIIKTVYASEATYDNPLGQFKKGLLQYGETVRELFVGLIKAEKFDSYLAQKEVFKRALPEMSAAYHDRNRQEKYKVTISDEELRTAFLTPEGVRELIDQHINVLTTSNEVDEYMLTKQLIIEAIKNNTMYPVTVPVVTDRTSSEDLMVAVKAYAKKATFVSRKYNYAKVETWAKTRKLVLFVTPETEAIIDVKTLSNMYKDDGRITVNTVVVDDFGDTKNVEAVLVDADWFQIYDNLMQMKEIENTEGLYWNYVLHVWQTLATSPFKVAFAFVSETPTITEVTMSEKTLTMTPDSVHQFKASVKGTGNYPAGTVFELVGEHVTDTTLQLNGLLYVSEHETATTLTVKATAEYQGTVLTDECVVTITK